MAATVGYVHSFVACARFPAAILATCKAPILIPWNRNFFSIGVFTEGAWQATRRAMQFPSVGELFLTSAITTAVLLTEMGVFIVLGLI